MTSDVTAKCPNCGILLTHSRNLIKEWDATPKAKAGQIKVTIHYWQCPNCPKKFRTATRVWLKQKPKPRGTQKPKTSLRAWRGTTRQ